MAFFNRVVGNIPSYIKYLLTLFLIQIAAYSLFRGIIYFKYKHLANEFAFMMPRALRMGLQYDLQVSAYILLLPFILFTIHFFIFKKPNALSAIAACFASIVTLFSFLICICDLPYFDFYKNRISADVLVWCANIKQSILFLKSGDTFTPYIISFIASIILSFIVFRFIYKRRFNKQEPFYSTKQKLICFILSTIFMIHFLRGAVATRPMEIRDAFFSSNAFVNNLSLNPSLCFFFTLDMFKVNYLPSEKARVYVHNNLHDPFTLKNNQWVRFIQKDTQLVPKNVVLIVLESLSANRMQYFGEQKCITPFLDSLTKCSIFFPNFYSSGTHTHNGLFGTLYGMPSLPSVHPFSNGKTNNLHYEGIASTLKKNNYSTSFYCTHNEEFDNLGFFLRKNGFDNIYSESNYPPSWHEHYLGISDEHLYQFAFEKLQAKAKTNQPFFDCIMTVTSHLPGKLPTQTDYKKTFDDDNLNVVHYADWALQHFIERCRHEAWFTNTIFVVLGDHGIHIPDAYTAPLSLNHIPLFFYNADIPPGINFNYGTQVDVYASLMELLQLSYENTSESNNLFRFSSDKAFFIQDNQICCIDKTHYLVMNKFGKDFLYDLQHQNKNVIDDAKEKEALLRNHVYSFLQIAQEKMDETR